MKRHHIVALFLLISGGVFAYIQFHHGDTDDAIQTCIICILLGVVAFFYEKLRSWLRPVGITIPVIIMSLLAADAAFRGDIRMVIFLLIGNILMGVLHFFQDTPFFKEKIEPYIGIVILLITTLFLLFDAFSSL